MEKSNVDTTVASDAVATAVAAAAAAVCAHTRNGRRKRDRSPSSEVDASDQASKYQKKGENDKTKDGGSDPERDAYETASELGEGEEGGGDNEKKEKDEEEEEEKHTNGNEDTKEEEEPNNSDSDSEDDDVVPNGNYQEGSYDVCVERLNKEMATCDQSDLGLYCEALDLADRIVGDTELKQKMEEAQQKNVIVIYDRALGKDVKRDVSVLWLAHPSDGRISMYQRTLIWAWAKTKNRISDISEAKGRVTKRLIEWIRDIYSQDIGETVDLDGCFVINAIV
jgi:cobalamin biosynthesis protein CobT